MLTHPDDLRSTIIPLIAATTTTFAARALFPGGFCLLLGRWRYCRLGLRLNFRRWSWCWDSGWRCGRSFFNRLATAARSTT